MRGKNRLTAGLLLASALALLLCRLAGDWLRPISLALAQALGSLTARVPFPLAELLAPALLLFLLIRRKNAAPAGAALLLSYILLWTPLAVPAARSDLHTAAELRALCEELIADANAQRESRTNQSPAALCHQAGSLMGTASPKMARYPEWMERFGLAGIYIPWTGEALLNGLEPAASLPFTACHEAAHAAGYADEAEANYRAYLACLKGDGDFRYSGALSALYYAMEALHAADYIAWVDLRPTMTKAVQSDFYALNGFHDAQPSRRSVLQNRIADAYLRLSGQSGLASYGAFLDFLLSP